MINKGRGATRRAVLAGGVALLAASRAWAADFYAGRTVTLVVPAGSGGSYGDYALLLAQHLPRFLPGAPAIVPQYLPGAGGMKASNFVANLAPKDGTTLYLMHENTATQQLLSPNDARYKAVDFAPIGLLSSLNSALAVREGAAHDLAGFRQDTVILASTGRGCRAPNSRSSRHTKVLAMPCSPWCGARCRACSPR